MWLSELRRATPSSRQVEAPADDVPGSPAVNPLQKGDEDDDQWLRELRRAPLGLASAAAGSHSAPASGEAETVCSQVPPMAVRAAQTQLSQNYGPTSRSTGRSVHVAAAAERLMSRRGRFATAARPTGRTSPVVSNPMVSDPTQTPSWISGEHTICPATGGSVLFVAQSRLRLAEERGSIRRGPLMVWHFPTRPVGGVEWFTLCRVAVNMVEMAIAGQPTVFKIGLTSDPLRRWIMGTLATGILL